MSGADGRVANARCMAASTTCAAPPQHGSSAIVYGKSHPARTRWWRLNPLRGVAPDEPFELVVRNLAHVAVLAPRDVPEHDDRGAGKAQRERCELRHRRQDLRHARPEHPLHLRGRMTLRSSAIVTRHWRSR